MKNLNSLLALCLMLFAVASMFSCSQDDDVMYVAPVSSQTKTNSVCTTRAEANTVLVNYLELVGDRYILNISEDEAEAIGVPISLFYGAQDELKQTNELIENLKKNPENDLQLTDPKIAIRQCISKSQDNPVPYGAPMGTLSTNGQEEVESSLMWAPLGTKGLKFTCRANAALTPAFNCKTYSSGTWQSKTAIGAIGTNTIIEVPIYVSNDYIKAAFSTTDSNGGSATYEGYN